MVASGGREIGGDEGKQVSAVSITSFVEVLTLETMCIYNFDHTYLCFIFMFIYMIYIYIHKIICVYRYMCIYI